MSIFTFPPELKVRLFKPFTLYQLLQMRLVSKQWKEMMETVGSFKRELRIVREYTDVSDQFNSLKLRERRFDAEQQQQQMSPDGAHFLSIIFPTITKATIHLDEREYIQPNCFNAGELLRDWEASLTYLDIDFKCLQDVLEVVTLKRNQLLEIISSLPSLTQLHIINLGIIQLPEQFPVLFGLKKLTLTGYANDMEYLVNVLHQVGPSLTYLAVDNLPELPESTIAKLSPSLKRLILYTFIVNGTFLATLRRFQRLTYLDLPKVFHGFNFSDLMAVLVDLPKLHTVSLSTILLDNEKGPPYSFPAHPTVRKLYLNSYKKLGNEMLQLPSFVYAFPNAKKVRVTAMDVHEVRRFLRNDDVNQSLENYIKQHFGEQTEVELVNAGHWDGIDAENEVNEYVVLDFDDVNFGDVDFDDVGFDYFDHDDYEPEWEYANDPDDDLYPF